MKKNKTKYITFDKSALKELCNILKVPYDKNIIAFTKKGAITNFWDLFSHLKENEKADFVSKKENK